MLAISLSILAAIGSAYVMYLNWKVLKKVNANINSSKWYIVQDKATKKYADGFFGWDYTINYSEQIFSEDDLLYFKSIKYKVIKVGMCKDKPSVVFVRAIIKYTK